MIKQIQKFIGGVITILVFIGGFTSAQNEKTFIFAGVNVIPMDREQILWDQYVIVNNGKITLIGSTKNIEIPKGAEVINANGKFMIPSLSDMHVHLEGDAWNIMFPPEKKFSSEEMYFEDILFFYVANGITTIDVLSALPEHIELKEKIKKNEIVGPRMILSRMIDAYGQAWPPPISTWINNPDEAVIAVKEIQRQGYDRVKVYSFLDKPSYDSIICTAKRINIPVDGHVPFSVSVEYVLTSGQTMIAHSEEIMKFAKDYSKEQVNYFASLISKSDVWIVSSLILNKNINALFKYHDEEFAKKGVEYLHPMAWGAWNFIYDSLYKPIPEQHRIALTDGYSQFQKPFIFQFYKNGGKLLSGTDTFVPSTLPAISLHEELEELVSTGLTPFEALRVSTTNTFEFLDELNQSGTIETGKNATFVLLDDNPLNNILNTRKIFGVMNQNKWISKDDIEERLIKIRNKYASLKEKKQF